MFHRRSTGSALLALGSLLAGCHAVPLGPLEVVQVQAAPAAAPAVFFGRPAVTAVTPGDGLGRLAFNLIVKFVPDPVSGQWGLLALPDGTGGNAPVGNKGSFDNAKVSLWSATASATYDDTKHAVSIPYASFSAGVDGAGYHTASAGAGFNALRPAANYQSRIFIQDDDGATTTARLSASGAGAGVTIQAGANNVDFTVTVNGNMLTYNIANSVAKNNVSDGGVVKGDAVTFNTGMANNQPGVTRLDVVISGVAYPATAIVKRIIDPAQFASFSWNTAANSAGAGETYLAASLVGGAGTAATAGSLAVVAYNSDSIEIGRAAFNISVFGAPTGTTVRIK